jgi:dihydrofolate reductase
MLEDKTAVSHGGGGADRMSLVRYYAAATLDGYIAESDDTLDWLLKYEGHYEGADSDAEQGGYESFYEGIGALVSGSTTYEWVLEHGSGWPYAGKPCWILSSRELPKPDGEGVDVRIVSGQIPDLIDEILDSAGEQDLWIVGGGNVASQFADHDLLDRVEVTIVPVVLGEGKPLFDRRLPGGPMQLIAARTTSSGMVGLTYEIRRPAEREPTQG